MYSLQLSPEQLEIRDTVRDFVTREIKPVALKADRLDLCDRSLLTDLLDQASQMGLRSLALSEERGGAGADALTSCIVTEELAAGDADIAAVLSESSRLAHVLFDQCMDDAQRDALLPKFMGGDRYHLAFAGREPGTDPRLGVNYHRPVETEVVVKTTATKSGTDWIINGVKDCVANAPVAGLFAVLVQIPGRPSASVVLVPADTPGLSMRAHDNAWQHGTCGEVTFKDCKVPAGNLLGDDAAAVLTGAAAPWRKRSISASAARLTKPRSTTLICACRAAAR
jgi:alkylation response protein AidB-like acyl-CoA dehydrogenase